MYLPGRFGWEVSVGIVPSDVLATAVDVTMCQVWVLLLIGDADRIFSRANVKGKEIIISDVQEDAKDILGGKVFDEG